MKKTLAAMVLAGLVMWLGYYLGYHQGVKQERQAWLATEQVLPDPAPPIAAARSDTRTSRVSRTFYSYPHSGQMIWATSEPRPVNRTDSRNLPTR